MFCSVSVPSLEQVKGGFNLQTTGTLDCSPFEKLHSDHVIQGVYHCDAHVAKPTTMDGSGSSSSSSSSSATSSGAAVSNMGKAPAMGLTAIICGLLQLLM